MKWHNTKKKHYPKNELEVNSCVDGINYEAIFFEAEKIFKVKGLNTLSFHAEKKLIYWQEKS